MNDSDIAVDIRIHLRKFAFGVAGPRDFAINLAINGTIAWWIFGGREAIPLTGSESIFVMLVPMAFIESTLTTFFGFRSGAIKLGKLNPAASTLRRNKWYLAAVGRSLTYGICALVIALGAHVILRLACPGVMLSPLTVVVLIGLLSGVLAYLLHARAVIASSRI